MDLSRLRTRRGIVAALAAVTLIRVVPEPVKAQLNAGCEYGITNGLVTIGGDNCDLAVPQHMVDAKSNVDGDDSALGTVGSTTQSPQELREERLQRRRDHVRTKRGRRTEQKQLQHDRRVAQRILCSDFSTQLDAVEAMSHAPSEAWRLDPDGDGIPCEELTPLTCRSLGTEAEAANWFKKMGYTPAKDPFKLYDEETGGVCTRRALCEDFSTQKEAVEWLTDHPKDAKKLDPDNDGAPCADLPPVTCKAFSTQDEAKQWFNRNGFTPARDPYKLIDAEMNEVCPKRATCDSFTTQKQAVEWLTDHPNDKNRLDPDGNFAPCANLPTVTCNAFNSQKEATNWFNHNNFATNKDPYGLYDAVTNSICPTKVICADFTDQKGAVEWMGQYGDPLQKLDPNGDGKPCVHLESVTCSQLTTEEGSAENVTAWFNLYFTPNNDPYKLYNMTKSEVCPGNG